MSSDVDAIQAAFFDVLIPGSTDSWPAFSQAVSLRTFLEGLADDERQQLAQAMQVFSGSPMPEAVAALENSEPNVFASVLGAAYRAYYTSPDVLAAVARLADAAPREPLATFDPDLVATVVATAAGKRRL